MRPEWQIVLISLTVGLTVEFAVCFSLHRLREDREIRANLDTITGLSPNYRSDGRRRQPRTGAAGAMPSCRKANLLGGVRKSPTSKPRQMHRTLDYVGSASLRDADRLALLDVFEELAGNPTAAPNDEVA
jgi:hypothetical protein